ncbi:shikimate kinase [Acidicapsa ligni]|uniref:shikimate kinase n=1 Tax=Acidicapsa ligni TaxID=542300 RepID=UPI0021DF9335|nr:shikimate kinase [Acidicapsa ligni]
MIGQQSDGQPGLPANFPRRIVLTGFMGAGKSTVGRLLAERLAWRLMDVDSQIESSQGMTITEIFKQMGEAHFRELEHQTIRELLHTDHLILALGGGAFEDDRTRDLLHRHSGTQVIHLEVSLPTVLERCKGTEDVRPVLANHAQLGARYDRRLPLYRQAHRTIGVDFLTPDAVVETILGGLSSESPLLPDPAIRT